MRLPFGIGRGMNEQGYNIQLSFDRDNEESQTLLKKCEEFDRTMIDAAEKNAFDWGLAPSKSQKVSREIIQSKYKPMVKYPKFAKTHPQAGDVNPEWPPYMVVQLPQSQGKPASEEANSQAVAPQFTTELYSSKKSLLSVSDENLPAQCRCTTLLYGTGYSSSTGFGVSWKAAQIMVFPRAGLPSKQCLIDEDGEDIEENETQGDFPGSYDNDAEVAEQQVHEAEVVESDEADEAEEAPTQTEQEAEELEETVTVPEPVKPEPVKVVPTPKKTAGKKAVAK